VLFLTFTSFSCADNWNQFRGMAGGTLATINHPMEWSTNKNAAWSLPMKGSGWSSPVVVGDRVFVTSAESENSAKPKGMMAGVASMRSFRSAKPIKQRFVVSCLSLVDGIQLWSKTVGESVPAVIHPSNTYATESPATDGERLFSFFATTGTLICIYPDPAES
jgi:outer membrane protein assembly factor BamB